MREKPDLPDERLVSGLRDAYGLRVAHVVFLPLGFDTNTAVYRVEAADATPYFLKLRSGDFDATTVAIPRFLRDIGIAQVIAPIATTTGALWTRIAGYAAILSPFVAGRDGWTVGLSDDQWGQLGVALRSIHTATLPPALAAGVPHEEYTPHWRDSVRAFLRLDEGATYTESVAAALAAFLRKRRDEIGTLVERAEQLGAALRERPLAHVLCHADIHAGNVLIEENGAFFIVDWDTLLFAPKERDLMFIGGGVGGGGVWDGEQEPTAFYRGYGATEIDATALAYYRHERIVEDIAAFCNDLLTTDAGGDDRPVMLRVLAAQFEPGGVVEIARRSDVSSP